MSRKHLLRVEVSASVPVDEARAVAAVTFKKGGLRVRSVAEEAPERCAACGGLRRHVTACRHSPMNLGALASSRNLSARRPAW